MPHIDPELLAVHALGEGLTDADDRHLRECASCAEDVASLRRVVETGRAAGPQPLTPPPDTVWAGIAAATSDSSTNRSTLRRPLLTTAVGVAAGIAIGVAGVLGWQAVNSDDQVLPLAAADLEPLTGTTPGQARLAEEGGRRVLTVELDRPGPDDGFYEVWLLSSDSGSLIALGTLDGPTGTFEVPGGLDLADFPVVDVSVEPYDGDPAHSGDSVVRGELHDGPA